jgi:hypothetical protein
MPSSRLDHARLDEIVVTLELGEADNLDRLRLWYQDLLREFWAWLKSATGGEDGWLSQFSERLQDWLGSISDQDAISGENILEAIFYGSVALVAGSLIYGAYRLWQTYRPLNESKLVPLTFAPYDQQLARPLTELPINKWAPAMFNQVCMVLAEQRKLQAGPDATNAVIVNRAELESTDKKDLAELAVAADRSLFGGWVPTPGEIEALRVCRDRLLSRLSGMTL